MRLVDLLRESADDLGTGSVGESRQLGEMFVDLVTRRRTLARGTNQQRPLRRRRQGDRITCDDTPRLLSERARGVEPSRLVELPGKCPDE